MVSERLVSALGNFDGVHRGHQALFEATVSFVNEVGADGVGAVVFDPHPRRFFRPQDPPFLITSSSARDRLIMDCGVRKIFHVAFDEALSQLSPEAFVVDVLKKQFDLAGVVTGEEFRFGAGRAGDSRILADLCADNGMAYKAIKPVNGNTGAAFDNEKIGSSGVRKAIAAGDMALAAKMLGRRWFVEGVVEKGRQLGRTIGFPTANFRLGEQIEPLRGVYAVRVSIQDETAPLDGVANFGRKPTVGADDPLLETFLFDFDGDIYGRQLKIAFVEFIREEKKFDGVDALKAQIAIDRDRAREILKTT